MNRNNHALKGNQYNSLKLLTLYFYLSNNKPIYQLQNKKSSKSHSKILLSHIPIIKKLYIPFLMIRLAIASILVIYFSNQPILQAVSILSVATLWTLYSIIYCPYEKLMKIFIHLTEIVFIGQMAVILYTVMQPETSRIIPAYVTLVLNGVQIGLILIFSILLVGKTIYGICQ